MAAEASAIGAAFEVCVYADDADEAVAHLRAHGVPILAEPADRPWSERVAYAADPTAPLMIAARRP
jgi:lactoylglutathione lyase